MKKDLWDRVTDWLLVCGLLVVILALIIVTYMGCMSIRKASDTSEGYYANSAVVTEIDRENDTVICEDFNGMRWAFRGVEDWGVGDGVSLLMCDNGTPTVYDDVVRDARYTAWVFSK